MSRGRPHRPSPPWSRAVRGLVAFWYLAAQMLVAAHLATVHHNECDEHGGLVHSETDDGHVNGNGVGRHDGRNDADGHDHCGMDQAAEQRAIVPVVAPVDFANPGAQTAYVPVCYSAPSGAPQRYLLPLKHAPPGALAG